MTVVAGEFHAPFVVFPGTEEHDTSVATAVVTDAESHLDTVIEDPVVESPIEEAVQTAPVEAVDSEQHRSSIWNRMVTGVRNNKIVAAAGAITVASLAVSPVGETIRTVSEAAPYAGPGMLAAEAAWIGGAAVMLAAAGKKIILNPFKARDALKDVSTEAGNSKAFAAGFALNTSAAVAEFVIPAVAVTQNMPPQSWGVLAFATVDLWATVALRRALWKSTHKAPDAA